MASNLSPTNTTIVTGLDVGMYSKDRALDPEHIALYLMLSFFSVLGVVGNAIAFYIFFKRRNSGTSVIFILALAGTDFITCLVTVPYTIVFEALQYRLYYDGLCKLYMFFITSTIPYSSFIMAGIAFDRYFCICHPFLHILNVQRARMVVLCLALPAFFFGIVTGMSYGMFVVDDHLIVNGSVFLGTNVTVEMTIYPELGLRYLNVSDLEHMPGGHIIETDHVLGNDSQAVWLPTYRQLLHNSECSMNFIFFTHEFQTWFRRVYTSCYALCFVTVAVLYVLIYKFICTRRAMKTKRRKKNYYTSVANAETQVQAQNPAAEAETAMSELNSNGNGAILMKTLNNSDISTNTNTMTTSLIEGKKINNTTAPTTTKTNNTEKDKNETKNTNGTNSLEGTAGESSRLPKRRGSTTRDRNLVANIKTAMMLFVVTLVFIVAFAPAWFMAHGRIPVQLNVFYLYFVYNVANPVIYAFMNQAFREDLKKLLKRS